MYWWEIAARAVQVGEAKRFAFITTNSLTQTFNRQVLAKHLTGKQNFSITFAIADHPWIDETGSAAVRVALSVAAAGMAAGKALTVQSESGTPGLEVLSEKSGLVGANLGVGADLLSAEPLRANSGLASLGATLISSGFIIDDLERQNLLHLEPASALIIRPYMSGRDLTSGCRGLYTIDAHGFGERNLVDEHPRLLSASGHPQ